MLIVDVHDSQPTDSSIFDEIVTKDGSSCQTSHVSQFLLD